MAPQGLAALVIVPIVVVAAFLYDKRKADQYRAAVDKKYEGRHVCDFKNIYYAGYIADNTLLLKERVKGYLQIDLTKVKEISYNTTRVNGVYTTYVFLKDENGKAVGDSKRIKAMSPKAADELIDLIIQNAGWIERP